jgi:hypothetical protein
MRDGAPQLASAQNATYLECFSPISTKFFTP